MLPAFLEKRPRAVTDPYADLGLDKTASHADIKRAYQRRAKDTHPDLGGDREEFERVQAAYDLLSQPQRRLTYDQTGRTEEPRAANETAALSLIAGLIETFIATADPELLRADLVELMRQNLRTQRKDIVEKMAGFAAVAEHTRNLMKRFKRKTRRGKSAGPDFITPMFERRLAQTLDARKQGEVHLENVEAALKLLEDYTFQKDDLSAHPRMAMGMMQFAFVRGV